MSAPPDEPARLTLLLRQSRAGDEVASEELFRRVFDDLHGIAHSLMRSERQNHTLQPTALVSEAWLRLGSADLDWQDRAHFFRTAARAMRRALVDHARARNALKREDRAADRLPLDEVVAAWDDLPVDVLDLNDALEHLAQVDAQLAQIVELRFFGGLSLVETGKVVGLTHQQVHRSWNLARAWLFKRLDPKGSA